MINRTEFPVTFALAAGGEFTVPKGIAGPAFREIVSANPVEPLHLDGVELPVEEQTMGDIDLPESAEVTLVPVPTAQYLAGAGRLPRNVLVPHGIQRDADGNITGFTGLGRVTAVPPQRAVTAVPTGEITELRVLTPHAATFYLDGSDKPPALTIPSSQGSPRVGRQDEQVIDTGEMIETEHGRLSVRELRYGAVDLPEPTPGVGYIVSRITASAAPDRGDLFVPVTVTGKDGRPMGCSGLNRIR